MGRKSSKRRANTGECFLVVGFHSCSFAGCDFVAVFLFVGFEDAHHMFSPIFGVLTEVADPEVRDIPKVGIPSLSLVHGGTLLSSRDLVGTPSPLTTPTSDLPKSPIEDYSKTGDEGLPNAPSSP